MKRPENDKWLDDALAETIGSEKPRTDFKQWKQKHPEAVDMLTSRVNRQISASKHPLSIRSIIMKNQITKYAAVLAIVIGVGAISVVGVNIGRYYYKGQNEEGHHIFYSEGGEGRLDDAFVTLGADEVTDIEQTRRDLEEIELLRQQDKRELLKVEEILRDGTIAWKVHEYKYELSDGRTKDMREGGDGTPVYSQDQFKEFKPKLEEFRQLKKAGQGEDLGTYEQTIKGRVFSFKREKYLLGDGTEFIWSVGRPKQDQ